MAVDAGMAAPRRVGRGAEAGRVVAIVGAGFSGTMAAIQLRRALPADCVVYLFDQSGRFARGPAYAPSSVPHLLNVRAGNMSALVEDAGHFERWMAAEGARWPAEAVTTAAGTFATRRLYGRYLRGLLHQEMSQSGGRVRLCADEVTEAVRAPGGWRLACASGRRVEAEALVLALGNLPARGACDGVVFHDPWSDGATAGLDPARPVMIVGTGLTMVDLVLAMRGRGFAGAVVAVSRRGLAPQRHAEAGAAWPSPGFSAAERGSARALLRRVRAEVRAAAAQGVGWRAVVDGLRADTTVLWQGLPAAERARFLRHVRPYWDVHRHRMAPAAAEAFDGLVAAGSLVLRRGRVAGVERVAGGAVVRVADCRGGCEAVAVQRVVHATGAGSAAAAGGLVAGLLAAGLVRADALGLGLDVSARLALVGRDGAALPDGWALGPIVRGVFWECTAVPDIRVQARAVAEGVAAALAGRGCSASLGGGAGL